MNSVGAIPNLVVAGVIKGGTTSLFWYLSQHPDICASAVKEVGHFLPLRSDSPLPPAASYARHFGHYSGQRYVMEATPEYFLGGKHLAKTMNDVLPDARIVLSLREPVARFWSHYNFVRSRTWIAKSTSPGEYLDRCEELHADGVDDLPENRAYWGLCNGLYDRYLDDWIEVFGKRLYVAFFEHLKSAPDREVAALCDWLDIDSRPARSFDYSVENKTVLYGSKYLQRSAVAFNRRYRRMLARRRGLKRSLRAAYYMLNGRDERNRLDSATAARVQRHYRSSNRRLRAQLEKLECRNWPDWVSMEA